MTRHNERHIATGAPMPDTTSQNRCYQRDPAASDERAVPGGSWNYFPLDFEALLLEEGARSFVLTYTSFIGRVFAEMNAYDRATKLPVRPWVIGELCDHIYPTCPAVARTGRLDAKDGKWWLGRYETVDDPDNILYLDPESNPYGDICGWCFRVWQSRVRRTEVAA